MRSEKHDARVALLREIQEMIEHDGGPAFDSAGAMGRLIQLIADNRLNLSPTLYAELVHCAAAIYKNMPGHQVDLLISNHLTDSLLKTLAKGKQDDA